MSTEITDLLEALSSHRMTLDEVAQRFRDRSWPGRTTPRPTSHFERAKSALEDPEPDLPGSFSEVTTAYDRGELTRAEYRVLAEAAAEAMRRDSTGHDS